MLGLTGRKPSLLSVPPLNPHPQRPGDSPGDKNPDVHREPSQAHLFPGDVWKALGMGAVPRETNPVMTQLELSVPWPDLWAAGHG